MNRAKTEIENASVENKLMDPVSLSQQLIKCKSIAPHNDGAIELVAEWLSALGFTCYMLDFSGDNSYSVRNLYAKYGNGKHNLCFAGHTDVVPVGDESAWKFPPFGGVIDNGKLYGRGAVDMKVAICCFIAAACRVIRAGLSHDLALSLLITGDEEADAINGTAKVVKWLEEKGEKITACIVGEPTAKNDLMDTIKIGRRGSINFNLAVHGVQGHVAYRENFCNPITVLVKILDDLNNYSLDEGNTMFEPSNLEVVNIDVGNKASNIVPVRASAQFNIRFNNIHNMQSLERLVRDICSKHTKDYTLTSRSSGEAYICDTMSEFTSAVTMAIRQVTGLEATINTTGGVSDARFIRKCCPVLEIGMVETTAHQVDECVSIRDIEKLTAIYEKVIALFGLSISH